MAWGCFGTKGIKPLLGLPYYTMFLLYADASGTPELQDASRHYVLLGVCVNEGAWFGLNTRIQRLKAHYCPPGHDFELHATQFAIQIREQEQIPNFADMSWTDRRNRVHLIYQARIDAAGNATEKARLRAKYRGVAPYIHLTRQERSQLLTDTLELVAGHEGIRLFAEAVSKSHPAVVAGQISPVRQAFAQVVSRFDAFLQQRYRWKLQRSDRPNIDNGLLILDQDYNTEATVQQQFDGFRQHGHPWGDMRHVIDVPFYASSDRLAGLQIADICAYAVRRYLDRGAIAGSHEEHNFRRIFHRFDQDSYGRLHGLRHFVQPETCNCLICQQRGHAFPPAADGVPAPAVPPA